MQPILCVYFPQGCPDPALKALAEACLRFSSQVALRPGEAVFLESGKSSWLYSSQGLESRLKILAARYQRGARLCFGQSAAEALALARFQKSQALDLPLEALLDYASPFHADSEVESHLGPLLGALKDLGFKDLGGLARLKRQHLGARFGPDAALLLERVEGGGGMAWPRFEVEASLEEGCSLASLESLEPCESLEALCFSLKILADRACARLRGRGLRAARLSLSLKLDRAPTRILDLALALPQGSPSSLVALLRERLAMEFQRQPLKGPALGLKLKVTETAPGFPSQAHFFDKREKETEAWNSLITRLSQKLGPDQAFLAELVQSYLPEKAWRKIIKEPAGAGDPSALLPLKNPVPCPSGPAASCPRPCP